jgi:phosphoribosylaminoimidazolecarboxamide formyltransferase/IMP cyclohydrolase
MNIMPKRALMSVSKKDGIVDFAKFLSSKGVEILSTGGTYKTLKENNIPVIEISEFTGFPEMLDGRVKTLHPKVHAGILNIRDNDKHKETMKMYNLHDIDLVVVNLYPFEETIAKEDVSTDEAIENIDIGGPSMIRSAAKNFRFVTVVTDPKDYKRIEEEINTNGGVSYNTRLDLSRKAFSLTAFYDSMIANYFNRLMGVKFPEYAVVPGRLNEIMRYGENPHQSSAFYVHPLIREVSVSTSKKLQGKELSFNNIVDINSAFELLKEFDEPAAVIVKHNNPCGVAIGKDLHEAYLLALECDPVSAFGGIVALNGVVDGNLAEEMKKLFLEVIIAPAFDKDALSILAEKKNLRLIETGEISKHRDPELDFKKVVGGFLLQDRDLHKIEDIKALPVPTNRKPTDFEYKALDFAWKVAKHVKSNAIVYANDKQTVGIGAGQMSRVDSSKIAVLKARKPLEGLAMASDAFFPFRDSIDEAAERGIKAIIQPGGSIRDEEVIKACDEHGIAMVFTGIRHFKH